MEQEGLVRHLRGQYVWTWRSSVEVGKRNRGRVWLWGQLVGIRRYGCHCWNEFRQCWTSNRDAPLAMNVGRWQISFNDSWREIKEEREKKQNKTKTIRVEQTLHGYMNLPSPLPFKTGTDSSLKLITSLQRWYHPWWIHKEKTQENETLFFLFPLVKKVLLFFAPTDRPTDGRTDGRTDGVDTLRLPFKNWP